MDLHIEELEVVAAPMTRAEQRWFDVYVLGMPWYS